MGSYLELKVCCSRQKVGNHWSGCPKIPSPLHFIWAVTMKKIFVKTWVLWLVRIEEVWTSIGPVLPGTWGSFCGTNECAQKSKHVSCWEPQITSPPLWRGLSMPVQSFWILTGNLKKQNKTKNRKTFNSWRLKMSLQPHFFLAMDAKEVLARHSWLEQRTQFLIPNPVMKVVAEEGLGNSIM